MHISKMELIETQMLCYDRKNAELGIDSEENDFWTDVTFDLSKVSWVRVDAEGTKIFFDNDESDIIVKASYTDLIRVWERVNEKETVKL